MFEKNVYFMFVEYKVVKNTYLWSILDWVTPAGPFCRVGHVFTGSQVRMWTSLWARHSADLSLQNPSPSVYLPSSFQETFLPSVQTREMTLIVLMNVKGTWWEILSRRNKCKTTITVCHEV